MRILVVEDEKRSRDALANGLRESGFVVDAVGDGDTGLNAALDLEYDLIVLDVMLPNLDGWQVLEKLRSKSVGTPVLFLTARDAVADRVKGLELGADDYLVKPFAWVEFLARVRTLLRRSPVRRPEILTVGDLELDIPRMKARRDGQYLELTAKEFQLLSLLARRSGEILSRTTIAELVWDMNFTTDSNAVEVAMGRLRKKVDEPFKTRLIHTQRGLGYTLEDRGSR
ncbi:heavy metal response regulator transcription factor [Roseimicrobium sp. ORNL1]|uniref:heavy metal response regulator transcription factor n=1 Tax=Roseimicrobium sp. ORNL1 TaxID=2711231 RepID=UPI0013E18388|nr:heavy metal response regulator transcription factor [Roseimicrobium sp. ORNL1]QIF03818.1 heavy metal response regulator transcription factor [Roseimicrobium sp. ORNL1]